MNKKKPTPGERAKKIAAVSIVRSSAAEYLTFAAAAGQTGIETVYADENVWLTQKMMGLLYDVATHTINYHLKQIFADSELQENSVIRIFRITAADGKSYDTQHYNLSAIIAVGYKVNSERAVQFRKWATTIVEQFTIKGYAMDDERLKNDGSILGKKYFEEQLQRVREIRLSERRFYQKITDIYATSIDYDVTAASTNRFFATVQNKLHWAIHGQTAAEVIFHRADAAKDGMGLTTWKDAPKGKIQKFDVSVAKNYLTENEMAQLQRLVSAYRYHTGNAVPRQEALEDVVATVVVDFFKRDRFEPERGRLRTYLRVLTNARIVDMLRKEKPLDHDSLADGEELVESLPAESPEEERSFQQALLATLIEDLREHIPLRQFEIFEMVKLKGISPDAAAAELGVNRGVIDNTIYKVMIRLREIAANPEYEEEYEKPSF